jgi:hypothetical protein
MANKLYAQYRNKTKLEKWAAIPRDFANEVITAAESVRDSYDIDTNSGDQLDVIGTIVQRDRSYIQSVELTTYECNTDGDNEFGDDDIQFSKQFILDDSDLSDDYYRPLLKAKIAKNNSDCTIDSILSAVNIIAPDIDVKRLVDGEDMTFSIEFYGLTDAITRDLLINGEIVPTPQGVQFNGFLEGFDMVECGDSDAEFNSIGDHEFVGFIGV